MLFRLAHCARARQTTRRLASVLVLLLVGAFHVLPAQQRPLTEIRTAIQNGIRDRVFPGAVVVVGRSDTLLYAEGFGSYAWGVDTRRPDPAWTLWDVASLTKVVATMSAAALLYDRGRLNLETPIHTLVPRFTGAGKDSVTFSMLLDHTSGLPAWVRLSASGADRSHALTTLFAVALTRPPGASPLYSDLNAILAALGIEQITGQPFERFTIDSVFRPTGMRNATWRPDTSQRFRAAPTQLLPGGHAILGSVNDANADVLGGVAGHAGVFATGLDLAHLSQVWLRTVRGSDSTWIHQATALRFLERSVRSGTRALGWDTPRLLEDGVVSLYGRCSTRTTWGHTGFTGTMIWFDPVADLFVVFLTNRSYDPVPGSMSEIRDVRTLVSDAARRLGGGSCR